MRVIAIGWICLAACGGAAVAPGPPGAPGAHRTGKRMATLPDGQVVDPIVALTPPDDKPGAKPGPRHGDTSWISPGPFTLELGKPAANPLAGASAAEASAGSPIEVSRIDREGNWVRVAIRRDTARFSLWIDRKYLLPVIQADVKISPPGGTGFGSEAEVVLHPGARIQRLAHREKEHKTQIRYAGKLEVEGWVADAVLGDDGTHRDGGGSFGAPMTGLLPGAVIRSEPKWAGDINQLAVLIDVFALHEVHPVDTEWSEVDYEDGDVHVHGFVSRHQPPGRLHTGARRELPLAVPSASVASGTCLYARPDGEPVGYLVGTQLVQLDDAVAGWWTVTLDSPWGPLAFAAKGARKTELVACAPPGTVPAVTPLPASP